MTAKSTPGAKELQLRAMRETRNAGLRPLGKRKPPSAPVPAVKPAAPRPSAGGAAAKAKKRQHA